MNTLQDLHDVLHEDQDLRPPPLGTIVRDGAARRRRRTVLRVGGLAGGLAAAAVLGVVGLGTTIDGLDRTGTGVSSGVDVAAQGRQARADVDRIETRLRAFVDRPDADLDEDSYVLGTPDADDGRETVPQDDAQWASLLWYRWILPAGDDAVDAELYVMVSDHDASSAAPEAQVGDGSAGPGCTNVYPECASRPVRDGLVAVERGPAVRPRTSAVRRSGCPSFPTTRPGRRCSSTSPPAAAPCPSPSASSSTSPPPRC